MLPNLKRCYGGNKFNLAADHQSLKDDSYRICCPNRTCFSSLQKLTKSAYAYQIASSTPKLVGSCATKFERVYKIPLKFSSSQHYPTHFYSFKIPQHPTLSPSFHHLLRLIILLLPFPRKITQEKDPQKTLFSPFSSPLLELVLFVH
jgi:hypothetical protein